MTPDHSKDKVKALCPKCGEEGGPIRGELKEWCCGSCGFVCLGSEVVVGVLTVIPDD